MKETAESVWFIAAVVAMAVILSLIIVRKLRARRNCNASPGKPAAGEPPGQSLRHPDFAAFAAQYGCPPPPGLRRLFENADSNLDGDFEIRLAGFPKPFFVAYFTGMIKETMSLVWPGMEGFFPFASDGSGNRYVVDPHEEDPTVYWYDHEIKKRESLRTTLSEFLAAKRTTTRW